ncbi:hypothetical protein MGG_00080 [Pyricularia oryzae 70-15]|uniref:C2H2-type domain-containing protein n=2 Tax=Pyricularia oryzae TaxID=318829 RepID=G4NEQ2_PYRO7|nr:uncharacterized protein MGG_00080 [Pyricularia oryzae 70-15]EHA49475.1 hypothetical protein MGG_00080 [Pyricularia oryzae 70-15]
MSYNNTYYNDSSGTQDPNAECKVRCSTTPLVSLFRAPISSTPPTPEPRTQPRPAMKTTYGLLTVAIFTRMPSSPSRACVRAVTGGTTAKTPRPDPATALSRAKTDRFSSMHQGGSSFKKEEISSNPSLHLRVHVKPVVCPFMFSPITPQCDRRTAGQGDMKRHVLAHHRAWAERKGLVDGEHVCPHCGDDFTRSDNLTRHIRNTHR